MNASQDDVQDRAHQIPWTKRARKAVYRQLVRGRDAIAEASPPWARRFFSPVYNYLDMFFIDHGMFRLLYANRYKVSEKAWRSAQPWPHQISYYAKKKNIRTILNLRGRRDCGSYRLEVQSCERHGITLRNDLKVYSRAAPSKDDIRALKDYFETIEYPVLFHCKSGADRVGLVSTLYLHLMEDVPIDKAREQLSWRYGHFKQAKTGILDHFFEQYLAYSKDHDIAFLDWVETVYDEDTLKASFHTSRWSSILADTILRRE